MSNGLFHSQPNRSIPVSLPQTYLSHNSSLPILTFSVGLGEILRLRYMGLYVPVFRGAQLPTRVGTISTTPVPIFTHPTQVPDQAALVAAGQRISSAHNSLFVGLFSGQFEKGDEVTGTPIFSLESGGTGATVTNPRYYQDIDSPGQYTLLVVNNTVGFDYDVVVTGAFRSIT